MVAHTASTERRPKVLMSAYACEPGKGSEPGAGWNWVTHAARFCSVWAITRSNNRFAIEAAGTACGQVNWVYYDLPRWLAFWKRGARGMRLYYYLWQIGAYAVARRLHATERFDLVHHVTFGTTWLPSLMGRLGIPFIWGPVGGAEAAPPAFLSTFGARGMPYEMLRKWAQSASRISPLLVQTARSASIALAKAHESAAYLRRLGVQRVDVCQECGITAEEFASLTRLPLRTDRPVRFLSLGRLIHWKGFHLGIQAFARIYDSAPGSEYWIIGGGPELNRLRRLAARLGVQDKVRFLGQKTRADVLASLADCDVLIHPSLHDSGGLVGPEAMSAGRPMICFDMGGPALQVDATCGFKIKAEHPEQAIEAMASAMRLLAVDPELRMRMAHASREFVRDHMHWHVKSQYLQQLYTSLLDSAAAETCAPIADRHWAVVS